MPSSTYYPLSLQFSSVPFFASPYSSFVDRPLQLVCTQIYFFSTQKSCMSTPTKIYVRNSRKYGKILDLPLPIPSYELYRQAAATQNLAASQVHLYFNGKPLPNDHTELSFAPQAIIHIINLTQLALQNIEVNVRLLHGRATWTKVQVCSSETIRDFIDDKLYKVFGQRSDKLILVHLGRQLSMDSTFLQQEVQDGSELFCVDVEEVKKRKRSEEPEQQATEQVIAPVKDLEVPQEPKDIYPSPNFLIETPQEINATSNMDLLFDAKIHHASSLPNYELAPEETIPEQPNLLNAESESKEEPKQIVENAEAQQIQERFEASQTSAVKTVQKVEETQAVEAVQIQAAQTVAQAPTESAEAAQAVATQDVQAPKTTQQVESAETALDAEPIISSNPVEVYEYREMVEPIPVEQSEEIRADEVAQSVEPVASEPETEIFEQPVVQVVAQPIEQVVAEVQAEQVFTQQPATQAAQQQSNSHIYPSVDAVPADVIDRIEVQEQQAVNSEIFTPHGTSQQNAETAQQEIKEAQPEAVVNFGQQQLLIAQEGQNAQIMQIQAQAVETQASNQAEGLTEIDVQKVDYQEEIDAERPVSQPLETTAEAQVEAVSYQLDEELI